MNHTMSKVTKPKSDYMSNLNLVDLIQNPRHQPLGRWVLLQNKVMRPSLTDCWRTSCSLFHRSITTTSIDIDHPNTTTITTIIKIHTTTTSINHYQQQHRQYQARPSPPIPTSPPASTIIIIATTTRLIFTNLCYFSKYMRMHDPMNSYLLCKVGGTGLLSSFHLQETQVQRGEVVWISQDTEVADNETQTRV